MTELLLFEAGPVPTRRVGIHTPDQNYLFRGHQAGDPWTVHSVEPNRAGGGASASTLLVSGSAEYQVALSLLEGVRAEYSERRAFAQPRGEQVEALDASDRAQLDALGYTGGDEALAAASEQKAAAVILAAEMKSLAQDAVEELKGYLLGLF